MTSEQYQQIGYDLIINEVKEESRVLDLGCGDGTLLENLQKKKRIKGFGVEISEEGVSLCVEKGLYCYQGDIDEGLSDYKENSFDYVILSQTLQSTKWPDYVLNEILRISKKAIVTFPNFGHIKTRLQLMVYGTMPKNDLLPYEWYESPNIHHATIKDFIHLCRQQNYQIEKEMHFSVKKNGSSSIKSFMPNIFAQYGFFVLNGEPVKK
jgi:methionine biosynthesis protein MetW